MRFAIWSPLFTLTISAGIQAAEPVTFNRDIRPILSNSCFKCHGPDLKKAGLDLQSSSSATKKLESGEAAIVPSKHDASAMWKRVTSKDETQRMPPKGEPLKPDQIAKLQTWIDSGAVYEAHWSYVAPRKPPEPKVKNRQWVRNPIDLHVLAKLEKEGLTPTPEAEKAVLLRRVSLDLTGLPPTLEEVEAFLRDKSPQAYEKAVDRLLGSKHYGEHMASWWLDMARYADTNGYEKDERRSIWPYRDWVINAFNRDLSFDQFTIEQLAGDLLPKPTIDQKIATGFHRNTLVNTEGGTDDEEFRVAAVVDRVNTTMSVWMGTTFACAQCHNHKFDPFSQKEYYQLFAFFNGTTDQGRGLEPQLAVPTDEEQERKAASKLKMARQVAHLLTGDPIVSAGLVRPVKEQITSIQKLMGGIKPATTLVLAEMPKPRATFIQIRGNHKNPGAQVTAGVPAKLHPLKMEKGQPLNRFTLARWLVSPENPLVGRVTMNRIWARYFGRGLVETSEDFGIKGELPTHPELLDYLATELVVQKWSLKAIQKQIVMSASYCQSTKVSPKVLERDPFNRLFARGPRFRMDAEMVRDNALAVSGLLNRKIGGPSVFPFQPDGIWAAPYSGDRWVLSDNGNQFRRGLYTFWRRSSPYAAFMAFDAPSREVSCERRPRTNTPLQALATLNDRVFVECSNGLARRMATQPNGDQERVIYGFKLCVSRAPTDSEVKLLTQLYRESLEKYRKDSTSAKKMALILGLAPAKIDLAELAAWTVVANVLLNLDETITKG
jgi:hypothetical protein